MTWTMAPPVPRRTTAPYMESRGQRNALEEEEEEEEEEGIEESATQNQILERW